MTETAAAPPVDDIWTSKNPELVAGRGYAWSPQAKPLTSRLNLLRVAAFGMMAVQLYSIMLIAGTYILVQQIVGGLAPDSPILGAFAQIAVVTSDYILPATVIIMLACAAAYVMFVHRGIKNLEVSGARNLSISAGWGAGSIFVPLVSWVVPFTAMRQLWEGSHDPVAGKYSAPMVVNIWWGTWIVGNLLGLILNYTTPREAAIASMGPEEYLSAMTPLLFVGSAAVLSTIISCFCLLTVAKQITAAQESLRSTSAFDA